MRIRKRITGFLYQKYQIFYCGLMNTFIRTGNIRILTTEETLETLRSSRISLSRLGDGEFALILGYSLGFQKHSMKLENRLKQVLTNKEHNVLVCIPYPLKSVAGLNEVSANFWKIYVFYNKIKISRFINRKTSYGDTQVTRLYMDLIDKSRAAENFEHFRKVWSNKNLLIVEGEKSRLGVGNDLFANSKQVRRIICPSVNAFERYEDILTAVKENVSVDDIVIVALGPTATILAYDLGVLDIRALDLGHIDVEYEWMLMGVTEKTPLNNKYVGDILAYQESGMISDDYIQYRKSIIAEIL